eukprot:scaffold4202_cov370-Prasinococcus_capsulatus_cf.AAC.5
MLPQGTPQASRYPSFRGPRCGLNAHLHSAGGLLVARGTLRARRCRRGKARSPPLLLCLLMGLRLRLQEEDGIVKVSVPVASARQRERQGQLTITCNFTLDGMDLRVAGPEEAVRALRVPKTFGALVPEKCYHKVALLSGSTRPSELWMPHKVSEHAIVVTLVKADRQKSWRKLRGMVDKQPRGELQGVDTVALRKALIAARTSKLQKGASPLQISETAAAAIQRAAAAAQPAAAADECGDLPEGLTALAAKEEGNKCFKNAAFQQAIKYYTWGISLVALSDDACARDEASRSLLATLLTNRATTLSQLGELKGVVADCSQALRLEPRRCKALVRRRYDL